MNVVKQQIHFNTKRLYSKFGQRITATLYEDNVVTFLDHDRKIDGEYIEYVPEHFGKQSVLEHYDGNMYKHSERSWVDRMTEIGMNVEYKGE
ncbi:hypothetical protein EVB91_197 [Rhizobium phage RHph_I1_18]|nr:hypothetical protein EVB91_197 [Rhizobium phage RHph_I1_18]